MSKQRKEQLCIETYEMRIAVGFRCAGAKDHGPCNSPTYYVSKKGPTCAWCHKRWKGLRVRS